jgi:hypothetical protein
MAFQISPGVNVSEVDLTTVVPSVLTTAGAFAGTFQWGPAEKIIDIDSEVNLVSTFGKPNSNTATSFFSAANFLAYGNNLKVVRAINSSSKNADSSSSGQILVKNSDVFESTLLNVDNTNTNGSFMARYPGAMGNSLRVSVCDNSADFGTWAYKGYFNAAPGTSDFCTASGGSNDELHIIVIDQDGLFTGTAGTVLEVYPFVSKASNATLNGASNYYKQVIFNSSRYVYAVDPVDYVNTTSTWGGLASTTFATLDSVVTVDLVNGVDVATTLANKQTAYALFANKDVVDISLIVTGDASYQLQQYIIDNISTTRVDCVAFISPAQSDVVNTPGNEGTNIATWVSNLNRKTTYAFADSGWKYQFDKYNNVYRWIPLNGDIAGLCVYTDSVRDPWFSPAGFNRGAIKNAIKLAWNPSNSQRDTLYASGVNPVASFPGQGIVLFGDKTFTTKPSAFDRINVRRLFIILEKAIATAAKYSLFELNDEFTRAQFVSLITPYLRDIQGRRGITDFKVVCDGTNNTSQVIDSNRFVGDIYIKPARSINYIQLNFVAVGSGVDFTTIVGAV